MHGVTEVICKMVSILTPSLNELASLIPLVTFQDSLTLQEPLLEIFTKYNTTL